jgi:cytochrome bd-type quinol oxidase subunit 1/mono/diheme cytochrome c family protein
MTAPMLIAAIAVLHVLISHYAVGGGLFLAMETGHAYRTGNQEYANYLKRHARFFILLTVVLGAITGVGIWWTIGLASPLSTGVLIQTFVFGWAIEWVFFVIEIVAGFIFYYRWGKLPQRTHLTMGWIYGIAAWISLVLITGITAFMLNPGAWLQQQNFWVGFFNPQFIPQTIARTGGALLLSSLYVYMHASLAVKDPELHHLVEKRSTRPALLGAVLILVGGAGWYVFLPESAQAALSAAAVLNVFVALVFMATVAVFVLLYLGPYRNPGWLSPGFAAALMLFGFVAFATGEFIREAVRKPYVIYNVVLGNQIFPEEVAQLRKTGFLEGGVWTKAFVAEHYPAVVDDNGQLDESRMLELDPADRLALGEALFQHHCNDCHAVQSGYSAVGPIIRGWTPEMLESMTLRLHEHHFFMPPWAGTQEEAELLAEYLASIAPPRPEGMLPMAQNPLPQHEEEM